MSSGYERAISITPKTNLPEHSENVKRKFIFPFKLKNIKMEIMESWTETSINQYYI